MKNHENHPQQPTRRRMLKGLAAGGGALATTRLVPESWKRPVVESMVLPAHAQTSPTQTGSSCELSTVLPSTSIVCGVDVSDGWVVTRYTFAIIDGCLSYEESSVPIESLPTANNELDVLYDPNGDGDPPTPTIGVRTLNDGSVTVNAACTAGNTDDAHSLSLEIDSIAYTASFHLIHSVSTFTISEIDISPA